MTKPKKEVEKLYGKLTAKERAKLEIARWRQDEEPDEALRRSIPSYQIADVNGLMREAQDANMVLGGLVLWLGERVATIEARYGIALAFRVRSILADAVTWELRAGMPEPITESENTRRINAQREERMSVDEAAWLLTDMELDDDELEGDRAAQEQRVKKAITAGELRATKGQLRHGELMDWCGQEVDALPTWGWNVAVLPDAASEYVGAVNTARDRMLAVLGVDARETTGRPAVAEMGEKMLVVVLGQLAECWGLLLALEEGCAIAAEPFDGEEVVHTAVALELEDVRTRIMVQVEAVRAGGTELSLPDVPDPEFLELLKRCLKPTG